MTVPEARTKSSQWTTDARTWRLATGGGGANAIPGLQECQFDESQNDVRHASPDLGEANPSVVKYAQQRFHFGIVDQAAGITLSQHRPVVRDLPLFLWAWSLGYP
jgi:hypothetical protein